MKPFPWHAAALERLMAQRERLPHALLVQGAAGIGKTRFAQALAAAVLCETPRNNLACGECASCHWLEQGNHPDYREVIPESAEDDEGTEDEAPGKGEKKSVVIKIEQVRALADFMALSTHRAGWRVLVLHPAEALHPNAANALLKTLEEPPPRTLIVLVSDRPARLLATIRSRCRVLALPTPAPAEALAWLRAEDIPEPQSALAAAGGAPLLAQRLAQPDEAQFRRKLVAELAKPGGADALQFAGNVDREGVERLLHGMQTWVHDLVRVRLAGKPRHHVDQGAALAARARSSDLERLFALDRELAEARRLVAHPLNARLLTEHLLTAYNRATANAGGSERR
jgi:DNA polymerase-3 subunit delta'